MAKEGLGRGQLRIDKVGSVLIFTDTKTGRKWNTLIPWMRALVFGSRSFYYANEYIPLPNHRPKGSKNKPKVVT